MFDHSSIMFPETAHFSGRVVHNEMQNHANDKRPNGTGWMDQITITKEADGKITTRSKTIYENTY